MTKQDEVVDGGIEEEAKAAEQPQAETEKKPEDSDTFLEEKILDDNKQFIKFFFHHIELLSTDPDYEQKKLMILMGILEAFKTFKNYAFGDMQTKKILKRKMKERIMNDQNLFNRLKKIVLLRERDRKPRENAIKILKKFIKFSKKCC